MQPRIDLLTIGVRDLDASRRFYLDGLGWSAALDAPPEVTFIQIGHGFLLSLWNMADMEREAGPVGAAPASITLGHIVATEHEVTEVLDRAVAAGATLLEAATRREWGGLTGYFADPDGYRWEIAWNPGFKVAGNGTVSMGGVE